MEYLMVIIIFIWDTQTLLLFKCLSSLVIGSVDIGVSDCVWAVVESGLGAWWVCTIDWYKACVR